ncbi:MAG: hypothetical protein H7062_25145 [Candidatus Saccharimonas sp.]|nr:hypothetical protein [Planctomycetaceae bacterium]
MLRTPSRPLRSPPRRGLTTPAVAVALIVAMGGLALIVDRLWLDAADLELTTAAESAALAAARSLASDDLLRPNADPADRLLAAREAASWIASQNFVAGDPVTINSDAEGDVRLGRLILDEKEKQVRFEESNEHPTTAVVTAQRTRSTSNPVGLFVTGLTGIPFGDVVSRVEATIDNRIVGVRPFEGTTVPALPVAIWLKDPTQQRRDTWEQQIEARRGADIFGYDPAAGKVYRGADGIPEIVLRSQPRDRDSSDSNMLVLDIGTRLQDKDVARQFASGWSAEDLTDLGGEMRVSPTNPETFPASPKLTHHDREALDNLIGEPRICLLYSDARPNVSSSLLQATCVRLVAIRVLAVRDGSEGSCELIAQPCVFATRTALLDEQTPYHTGLASDASTENANPYIYKLQLTH